MVRITIVLTVSIGLLTVMIVSADQHAAFWGDKVIWLRTCMSDDPSGFAHTCVYSPRKQ